jgi:hypothetical protein
MRLPELGERTGSYGKKVLPIAAKLAWMTTVATMCSA